MPADSDSAASARVLSNPGAVTWHRYVRIADVPAYLALGWTVDGHGPMHPPHGCYAIFMDWMGPGEPVEPAK